MSVLPLEIIKNIAEHCGISSNNLKDDAAVALSQDVEYRLREIIQVFQFNDNLKSCSKDAMKFMRHAKRMTLLPDDINSALKVRNVQV